MRPVVLFPALVLLVSAHDRLTLRIQSDSIPSLNYQDWSAVINAHPASLASSGAQVEPEAIETKPPPPSTGDPINSPHDQSPGSPSLPLISALPAFFHSLANLAFSSLSRFSHIPWSCHHHGESIDLSQFTIGEILNWILHHPQKPLGPGAHPVPLHRLAWLVNQSEPIQKVLSDPDADLTLFAPDDEALTPPHKRRHHAFGGHSLLGTRSQNPQVPDDLSISEPGDHVFWQALATGCPHTQAGLEDEDEDKTEKKKKILLHLLEVTLKYHVSPGTKSLKEIVEHSTLPSALHIKSDPSSPVFRIRVGGPPHFTKPGVTALNFFTELGGPGIQTLKAKNGVIHLAHGFPLLPPFTPLTQLFMFPKPFSTLTSALQQTKLDDILLPSWVNKSVGALDQNLDAVDDEVQSMLDSLMLEHKSKVDIRGFTVFSPTNHAFQALDPHLTAFLFSPFGSWILRYILSYHIVPDIIWHTDHCEKITHSALRAVSEEAAGDSSFQLDGENPPTLFGARGFSDYVSEPLRMPRHPPKIPWDKVNITNVSLPTLLGSGKNESLHLSLVEYRLPVSQAKKRQVFIHQPPPPSKTAKPEGKPQKPIPVEVPDVVAWAGAIHVIPALIRPPVPADCRIRDAMQRLFPGPSDMRSEESLFS